MRRRKPFCGLDYRVNHKACEACGDLSFHTHHIKSRGAGGGDNDENLLALCIECHTFYHTAGWSTFYRRFPHLADKIKKAKGVS